MRKSFIHQGVLLSFVMLLGGAAEPSPAGKGQAPTWLTDYAAAKATARQHGKPLLVVFR